MVAEAIFWCATKASSRQTGIEFAALLPSFARRLQQRHRDFILMRPVLRRLAEQHDDDDDDVVNPSLVNPPHLECC